MMVPLAASDLDRMVELVEKYADFPLGLVDASVIAVAERFGRAGDRDLGPSALLCGAPGSRPSVHAPAVKSCG